MNIKELLDKNKEEFHHWLTDNEPEGCYIKILPYLKDIEKGFYVEAGAQRGTLISSSNTKLLEDCGWSGLLIEPATMHIKECTENRPGSMVECCALVSSEYPEDTISASVLDLMDDSITTECKAKTFNSVAQEYSIKHIDFFSLDVEGYEIEVLKGIDFSKVVILHFLIECNTDKYSQEEIDRFMENNGYKKVVNISNYSKENWPSWKGTNQDYLYSLIK